MAIRVTVTTQEEAALVLVYPRDGDPVAGEAFTEVAMLPPHRSEEFTVGAGFDLLVAEHREPIGTAACDPAKEAA